MRHNELLIKIITEGHVDTVMAHRSHSDTSAVVNVTFSNLVKKWEGGTSFSDKWFYI